MDKDTASQASFASAKVVIDTLSVNPIEDEAIIQVKDKGFRVSVFETKTEYTIIHMGPMEEEISPPSMKNTRKVAVMDSNGDMVTNANLDHDDQRKEQDLDGVKGAREDEQPPAVGGNSNLNPRHTNDVGQPRDYSFGSINVVDDVEKNKKLSDAGLEDARSEGTLGASPLIDGEAEEGNGQLVGRRISNDAISVSSSTKTKSVQLSGNGYSEEMEKIFGHKQTFQAESIQHYDIEKGNHVSELPNVPQVSELSIPPGFGNAEVAAPPGFEVTKEPEASPTPTRKSKVKRRIVDQSSKRLTRSQLKQCKMSEAFDLSTLGRKASSKEAVEDSPQSGDSASTSESIVKIAREALEIGKILGVKVITHDANARKRITSTIKSNRRNARS